MLETWLGHQVVTSDESIFVTGNNSGLTVARTIDDNTPGYQSLSEALQGEWE